MVSIIIMFFILPPGEALAQHNGVDPEVPHGPLNNGYMYFNLTSPNFLDLLENSDKTLIVAHPTPMILNEPYQNSAVLIRTSQYDNSTLSVKHDTKLYTNNTAAWGSARLYEKIDECTDLVSNESLMVFSLRILGGHTVTFHGIVKQCELPPPFAPSSNARVLFGSDALAIYGLGDFEDMQGKTFNLIVTLHNNNGYLGVIITENQQ